MARTIYLTAPEGDTGKSVVALGLLDLLTRTVQRVGIFRPIARSTEQPDWVVQLLLGQDGIDTKYDDAIGVTYEDVIADPDAALSTIVSRFHDVERANDAVLVVGTDYTGLIGPTELAYNARIAANLGAPVVLVVRGLGRTPEEIHKVAEVAAAELAANHAQVVAVVANRCEPADLHEITLRLRGAVPGYAVPGKVRVPIATV